MALEDSVNTLVNNTTALLTAVNVSKATLDTSTASAAGSATVTTANAAAASASASAASASASAASTSASNAAASAASASAIVLGVASGMPSIKPTLNLDFANSQTVDPRITFTRTGTAAYYDGKTTAMAEENLLLRSQEFDNAAWTKNGSTVTANSVSAPDGTNTADSLIESSGGTFHYLDMTAVTVASGGSVAASIYVKQGTRTWVYMSAVNVGNAYFDVANGITGTTSGGVASIMAIGNGWYRCSITGTASSASSKIQIYTAVADGTASYAGDGTSGIYIWGAQLEQRSTVTAYTPTTTQAITNYIPAIQYAPANTPRIDFDPITGECKGLLIEEQRTNLLTYSEQFDNGAWTKSNSTITANTVVAPDGTLTADKLVEDTVSAQHAVRQDLITAGQAIVFSICAKASERTQLNLRNGNLGVSSVFNLTAGTIVSTGAGQTAAIIPLGNNWYRCSISFTSTVGTQQFLLGTAQAGNVFYTGDGYSGIYIWGAQLEAGAFPTSYIPTVASQVTRGADSASMTGVNFSSWYRQDAGSFYSEFDAVAISATTSQRIFEVGDGTVTTPSIDALISGVATSYFGAAGPFGNGATVSANTFYKFASARAVNDFACVRSGGTPTTNSSAVMPQSYTQLNIGNRYLWDRALNGHIKKLSYYPKRLSNTELQALTA